MRAQEFIPEGQEYWEKLETPEITKARDQMRFPATAVDDFGRVITPGTIQNTPVTPVANTKAAKKVNPWAGYPGDFESGYATRITPKTLEPLSGVVQLGPNKFVQPGTEEYAQLKKQVDPTGTIHYYRKPTPEPSPEVEKKLQQRNQEITQQFKPNTSDKGKEVTWPSRKDPKYYMIDPAREKYRT